jgi:nicotinamidase/pyrazinamidase
MKKSLLIVDMLYDFIRPQGALPVPDGYRIVPFIKEEINKAKQQNYPVIYLCDSHIKNDQEFEIWPQHCVKGTKGAQIIKELSPSSEDIIVEKTTYSGFYKTELESILDKNDIDTLIITGVVTNICILYTSADARMRGYEVIIPKNCVAALNENDQKFGLKQLQEVLHCKVV